MTLWRTVFHRQGLDRQLDAELQFHLEQQVRDYVNAGMSEDDARRKARLAFGGLDGIREDCREARGLSLLDSTLKDLSYALRGMRKSWLLTTVVVLTLALGIGANTAIFTLIDAVMLRMLPVKDPQTLLVVGRAPGPGPVTGFTFKQFRAMRDGNEAAEVAGYAPVRVSVSVDGSLEPTAEGQLVSGNYFPLLGVQAVAGRTIGIDDDRVPNGHPVAVISHGYWKRRLGMERSAIGRTISISGMPFTIIGVAPQEFFGVEVGTSPDVFVPMMMQPTIMPASENLVENPIIFRTWVQTLARLKAGISADQAAAVLHPLQRDELPAVRPGAKDSLMREQKLALIPAATGLSELRRQFSQPLFLLMTVVGIVLLIACANIANLLLARAAARRPEFAMRLALGAGRGRLMRQLLLESITLAALGGLGGVLLAQLATQLLVLYMSSGRNPIVLDLNPDLRILAFTATVSVVTGIVFGLVPALRATRIDLTPALKNLGGRTPGNSRLRPGKILAVVQVSLSLLLLIGAGLFVRTLQNLNNQDSGFSRDSVLIVRLEPRGSDQRSVPGTSERLHRLYTELLQRLNEIPGVRSASLGNVSPTRPDPGAGFRMPTPSGEVLVSAQVIYPQYFETLGIPMDAGRDFGPADLGENSPAVCIVNETYARLVFPDENSIGKPCGTYLRSPMTGRAAAAAIIGVARDSRYTSLRNATRPVVYAPFLAANTGRGQMILHVRSSGNASSILPLVREEVWKTDKDVPQFEIRTLAEEVDAVLIQERLIATLSSFFSVLALLLASVGLYGLLAFAVVQRTGEMGIRMALGAARGDLVWMILREAVTLVLIGIAIGVPAALAVARLASSTIFGLLFGLSATDSLTISTATALLLTVATIAAYFPARRASRVDPMVALRNE